MRHLPFALFGLLLLAPSAPAADIPIVVDARAHSAERIAAAELAGYLGRLYPNERFVVTEKLPAAGKCILVGDPQCDPRVKERIAAGQLKVAESFAVAVVEEGPRTVAVVAGADPRGTVYAVYTLLEKLGCGFYLSYDALPPPSKAAFSFAGWEVADRPLVRDRMVFNWHNFLSGCSTWNLPEWKSWIVQSQKQGYNGIMVHAYGNNPMVSFEFNGRTKPVGYLSTTVKGRDWSTMHVNDVRRLWGGEVFGQAVFGADAAIDEGDCPDFRGHHAQHGRENGTVPLGLSKPREGDIPVLAETKTGTVPDAKTGTVPRADAAQKLMQNVFVCAAERAMEVYFAVDVDTLSANPQELIATLPAAARFATGKDGKFLLADPDTPEGYRYYKAQVDSLLAVYPQIGVLVVWFRNGNTPWTQLKLDEMPAAWQKEYAAEIAKTPEAAKLWYAPQMFAIGKIVRAFDRALKERGHDRVQLASGTWNFPFLAPCDRFFPPHVKLIGLDYGVLHERPQLGDEASRGIIRDVAARRPVVPVIWAHHDDGHYIGRPYTPFAEFHSKLSDAKAAGFGIIHWTTRPLDLFFASHARQVWQRTKDEPLRATCDEMAKKSFGMAAVKPMGEYLHRWVTEAPRFARETSEYFIDRPLKDVPAVVAGCRERLKLIESVDRKAVTREQRDRLDYFCGLEEFIAAFHETHAVFQNAQELAKKGDLASARTAMAKCRPEPVIEQFAKFSSLGGITRGEQGLVVSMNTRWLPHIVRLRQTLGMEPVRINFGPTSHDPLAQSAGRYTFFFDAEHRLWQTLGSEETGAEAFVLSADTAITRSRDVPAGSEEICRSGIESDKPITLKLSPILHKASLPPGKYEVRLLTVDPSSTARGQRVFTVSIRGGTADDERCSFEPVKARYLRLACRGNSENDWNSIEEVELGSLAKDDKEPRVTASNSIEGYLAAHAIDGKPDTRWAVRGRDQWIQFRLDPAAATDAIAVRWFAADKRQAKFDVLYSDDGKNWNSVRNLRRAAAAESKAETIDVFQQTGERGRILVLSRTSDLTKPGEITVTLTPVKGKAIICGAVVSPIVQSEPKRR
jgi:hypothetical protein